METLIGLSLSFSIRDILMGKVKVENVKKIITAIRCPNEETWALVIKTYKQSYWKEFPKQAEKLVYKFIGEGKIEQPRLKNNDNYPKIEGGHWVNDESEINWNLEN